MSNTNSTHTNFVVLFQGRSGSTYLIEALNSHHQILAEKEKLAAIRKQVKNRKQEQEDQIAWARSFWGQDAEATCRAVGFKTKLEDVLQPELFAELLRERNVRIILLHRGNVVKQVVSLANAIRLNEQTGEWNLYSEEDRLPPMEIAVDRFELWLQKIEERKQSLVDYARSLTLPVLELFYEELLTRPQQSFAEVCDFLGVSPMPLEPATKKNTQDDLRAAVANFDELRSHFVATIYESMFDEVLVHSEVEE